MSEICKECGSTYFNDTNSGKVTAESLMKQELKYINGLLKSNFDSKGKSAYSVENLSLIDEIISDRLTRID